MASGENIALMYEMLDRDDGVSNVADGIVRCELTVVFFYAEPLGTGGSTRSDLACTV